MRVSVLVDFGFEGTEGFRVLVVDVIGVIDMVGVVDSDEFSPTLRCFFTSFKVILECLLLSDDLFFVHSEEGRCF